MSQDVYSAPRTRPAVRGEARDALVGDSCQARYFRRVLAAERAQLDEKLANDMGKLSALGGFDEALGAKALRRRIRVMQRKRRELDRLIDGLDGWL